MADKVEYLLGKLMNEFGSIDGGDTDGFFYKTRQGGFEQHDADRVLSVLNNILEIYEKDDYFPIAKQIYILPMCLYAWRERNEKSGVHMEAYDDFSNEISEIIRSIMYMKKFDS
jgi:hypothetical protein